MIILDSDVCIEIIRNNRKVIERRKRVEDDVAITFMSVGELYYGVYKSSKPEENARILEIFLLSINVIFPDMDIMKEFGELKYYLYHKNLLLTDADILIAATCLSKSAKLVTGNLTHFKRFPGLILDNWAK